MTAKFQPGDVVTPSRVISEYYESGNYNGPVFGREYKIEGVAPSGGLLLDGLARDWDACNFDLCGGPRAIQATAGCHTNTIAAGRKDDTGKLDITLLFDDMPHALEAVTEVLQWAITKKQPVPYERGSWQNVPDFQQRYRAAQLRHMLDAAKAAITRHVDSTHTRDAETGLLQLAHIATDALFQLEMAVRAIKEKGSE